MNVYQISAKRKSDPDEYRDPRVKHIEEWVRVSTDYRNKKLGENFYKEAEDLYSLNDNGSPSPTFRPLIRIPELQKMMLEEANKVSDCVPQVYIFSGKERDKQREKSLQAQWYSAKINQHILYASLTARYCGVGFICVGFEPNLRNGKGGIWAKSIDPRNVGFDPSTDYTWDPSFEYWETWMNLEEVRKLWPHTSKNVRPRRGSSPVAPLSGDSGYGFEMPTGPMNSIPGMPVSTGQRKYSSDTRVLVRNVFFKDYTRELVEERDLPDGQLTDPEFMWKYPNGRWIVECEGIVLSDGDNPYPKRTDIPVPAFPLTPIWALPPLYSCWGIPVTKMTNDLQMLSQRLYTQTFENAIRLNNGVWFIDQNTGIDPEAFGGLPGEVQVINPGTRPPTQVFPQQMPAQMISLPEKLLELQRQVLGFTDARQGNPGAGNISTDLFDASVLQSSGMLQLTGKLLAGSCQWLADFMFYTMGRYCKRQNLPFRGNEGIEVAEWEGLIRPDEYDVMLDEASIRPLSEAIVRKMTPELMKTGIVSTERGLRAIGYPDAEEIAAEQKHNLELQALARVKGAKK